jgi:hypothetical protein
MPSTRQPAGDVLDAGLRDPKISIVVGLQNQAVTVGISVSAAASWFMGKDAPSNQAEQA